MGYTLRIGNAELEVDMSSLRAWFTVERVERPWATRNSSGDKDNECSPSYTAWADFARRNGLYDLFFKGSTHHSGWWTDHEGSDHAGLMCCHPGCEPIKEAHLHAFRAALNRHRGMHTLYMDPDRNILACDSNVSVEEVDRRRLIWLVEWTEWALEDCEHPAMENG